VLGQFTGARIDPSGFLSHFEGPCVRMSTVFDLDDFIARCIEAHGEDEPRRAVREVLTRALTEADALAETLQPSEAGFTLLHHTDDLTIIHVVWTPGMDIYPHDHRMWAAIGIYAGQEDNTFFRRSGPGERTLTESGGKTLTVGDAVVLGGDTIHAVHNPRRELTGAIHVYDGDFINQERSQWGPGPREERPYDIEDTRQRFADANAAWNAASS
jgi:predicted metal-dependent enzyme (double-stranded beta helix superfamily)